jgi:hypothetical protein
MAYLQHTFLIEYLPLPTSAHHLHVNAGKFVGVVMLWHSLWHLVRWGIQDNFKFLVDHPTGITGLICMILTPIIVWPMQFEAIRKNVSFEIRKRLHYLSWVWLGALCFHAPQRNVFWIAGSFFILYLVDWTFGMFVATRLAPSARFVKLESAVLIRLVKPPGFQVRGAGGYCYLNVPWISKEEWHAFSTFKDPHDDDYIGFLIAVAGDWTKKLHSEIHEPVDRRLWINGPYPSPFELASNTDNVISVASGIGITPALSAIKSLANSRRMHLIWMVRDPSLLEFMFDYGIAIDDDAYTLIFYTGKRELVFRRPVPYNVLIFKGRPNLDDLIVSLIRASLSRKELVLEDYEPILQKNHADVEENTVFSIEHEFYKEVTRLLSIYSKDELFRAAVQRSHLNSRRISFEGWKSLIKDIFLRPFTDEELQKLFSLFDENASGTVSREEYDSAMNYLEESSKKLLNQYHGGKEDRSTTEPSRKSTTQRISIRFEGDLDAALALEQSAEFRVDRPDHWRLLYCGGSLPVVTDLKKISAKHHIPLSTESFSW